MHQSLMSCDFICEVRPQRERVVVDLAGEFDVAAAARVAAVIEDLLEVGFADIVIDLRDLSFMDSAGVHSLVSANCSAGRRGASLSLVRGPRGVHRVLTLTATDSLFAFEDDGAEGLTSWPSPARRDTGTSGSSPPAVSREAATALAAPASVSDPVLGPPDGRLPRARA